MVSHSLESPFPVGGTEPARAQPLPIATAATLLAVLDHKIEDTTWNFWKKTHFSACARSYVASVASAPRPSRDPRAAWAELAWRGETLPGAAGPSRTRRGGLPASSHPTSPWFLPSGHSLRHESPPPSAYRSRRAAGRNPLPTQASGSQPRGDPCPAAVCAQVLGCTAAPWAPHPSWYSPRGWIRGHGATGGDRARATGLSWLGTPLPASPAPQLRPDAAMGDTRWHGSAWVRDEPGQRARAGLTPSISQEHSTLHPAHRRITTARRPLHQPGHRERRWDPPRWALHPHPRGHPRAGVQQGHPGPTRAPLPHRLLSTPSRASPRSWLWVMSRYVGLQIKRQPRCTVPAPSAANELLDLESVQLCSSACLTPRADKPLNHSSPRCQATWSQDTFLFNDKFLLFGVQLKQPPGHPQPPAFRTAERCRGWARPAWARQTPHQWNELDGLSCTGKSLKTVCGEGAGLPAMSIAR